MDQPECEFQETLQAAKSGSFEAFHSLFKVYEPGLLRIAKQEFNKELNSRTDIEEILHETLFDSWQSIGQFQEKTLGQFKRWLITILLNKILMAVRFHKKTKQRSIDHETQMPGSSSSGSGQLFFKHQSTPSETAMRQEELDQALQELSPEERQILEDFLRADVDELLPGVPRTGIFNVKLQRAFTKLRKRFHRR
jgi:RNA polymerase sigma factor (sigma-70 family)